jgi:diguanylate cyclase (GGDEF)-like protein
MRLRLLISLAAVLLIAAGSVAAALIVHSRDETNFERMQHDQAVRAAHQADSVAKLTVGELSTAATVFQIDGNVDQREFGVVARSLLDDGTLQGATFIERVPAVDRARYEAEQGVAISDRIGGARHRAGPRPVYYPVTYAVAQVPTAIVRGFDLRTDGSRAPYLADARDSGQPVSTRVLPLLLGGFGVNVYQAIYREGAPTRTVAERRRALVGFVAAAFRVSDLAAAAITNVPAANEVQLVVNHDVVLGPEAALDDPARARFQVADRTWVLVVRDPSRPSIALPLLLGVVGLALSAVLGALIFVWSRNERMQELQREASEDPLTGLKNRRRFDEDLRLALARARRERTTGALVMLDLDHFKQVNDTRGHPAGDQLIVEIAEVLRQRTRESDSLARLGGDEFAVILPRCTLVEARLAAEAIARAIREHEPLGGEIEPLTASVGVAMFGDRPRANIAAIVSEADAAMYEAKDDGRDRVRIFDRHAILEEGL